MACGGGGLGLNQTPENWLISNFAGSDSESRWKSLNPGEVGIEEEECLREGR